MSEKQQHSPHETAAELAAALPDRLTPQTPLQTGRATPPAPSLGGGEIRLTIEQPGQKPLVITIRTPAQEAVKDAAQPTVTHTHLAGIGTLSPRTPDQQIVPTTTVLLNHLFQTRGEQMDAMEKRLMLHEGVDNAMKEAFAPMMQSLDPAIFIQVTRVVNQVMADLLSGNQIFEVDAEELMKVRDAIIDHVKLYVKNEGKGSNFNIHHLRQSIHNHPEVSQFRQSTRDRKANGKQVNYHPKPDHHRQRHYHRDAPPVEYEGKLSEATPEQTTEAAMS